MPMFPRMYTLVGVIAGFIVTILDFSANYALFGSGNLDYHAVILHALPDRFIWWRYLRITLR